MKSTKVLGGMRYRKDFGSLLQKYCLGRRDGTTVGARMEGQKEDKYLESFLE
jgi:hypothetical protein